MLGFALTGLGVLAETQGEDDRARALLEESLELYRTAGDSANTVSVLNALARLALRAGNIGRAAALLVEALQVGLLIGQAFTMLETLEDAVALAHRRGALANAARLAGAVAAARERASVPRRREVIAPYDNEIADLRTKLSEDAFAAAWDAGRALSLDEAVAEALAVAGKD